jgi:Trk K+ transport system NAD-binding subunit
MKYLPSQLLYFFLQNKTIKKNIRILVKFLLVILATIILYSILFHSIMEYEGMQYSWITGFYWTLTVMSTLGFGDITFTSDLGRVFSIVVLLTGIIFLLILLPFTVIRFFYAPWLESQAQLRTPRELPEGMNNHIVITNFEPIAMSLIKHLSQYNFDYVIAVNNTQAAAELLDMNYKVVIGELDKPETYRKLRVDKAALVVVNNDDMLNTNIIATIREVSDYVPIITTADAYDSIDILELAGATHVFQFTKMLGVAMAHHTLGVSTHTNIIGSFGEALIAKAYAAFTPYEGKKLEESRLREITGVNVVGIWQRGKFEIPRPETVIHPSSTLLLSGSAEHFSKYDDFVGSSRTFSDPVVILGGGRVGQAAAETFVDRKIEYRVVEKNKNLIKENKKYILGNAADIHVLERAGITEETPSVLITTHSDDINIYLTIYCRKLRPNIQIISRAVSDSNISKLYSVGADFVISYSSMGANKILNILMPDKILMMAEGLTVFKAPVPASLAGKTLAESQIRRRTGCNVVAINSGSIFNINPDPAACLNKNDELVLISTTAVEKQFINNLS